MVVQRAVKAGRASKSKSVKAAKMPKPTAGGQSDVTWILLSDALALIADAYQMHTRRDFDFGDSPAENMLRDALKDGRLRSRGLRFERTWKKDVPQRPPSFEDLRTVWKKGAWINWQMSSADMISPYQVYPDGTDTFYRPNGTTYRRIEIAREDLLKLLPDSYELPQQQPAPRAQRSRGGGRPEQYEWDVVFAQFLRLIEEDGWPQIQSYREFANKVCDACAEAGMEPTPSVDTVREKISIWCSARRR
jgi:hypothetical protein